MENSEVAWLDRCASSFETSELLLGCVEQGEGLQNTESETQKCYTTSCFLRNANKDGFLSLPSGCWIIRSFVFPQV